MRRAVVVALIAAVAACAATAADAAGAAPMMPMTSAAALGPTAITSRIVNGTLTSLYPSVGALLTPGDPGFATLLCSGTLIGCHTFLTAGHCVCPFTGADCQSGPNAPNPADYVVFLQHGGFFTVSSIAVNPDFNFPVGDVALLTLAAPVTGIAPTPIDTTSAPAFGSPASIVGFGKDSTAADYGLKRAGAVTMASCVKGVSNTTSVCWDFADPLGPPGTDADTCNGDSGGPLFADFQCGDTVAGITSGGTSGPCVPTDHSYDANVFHYRDYIAAQVGGDLGSASCGAMPQAGDPNTVVLAASGTLSSGTPQGTHTVDVPAGTTLLRIAMNASEDQGADFDLYVKSGSPPSVSDFDCKADGPNQYGFCEFPNPATGTWYVLVQRFQGTGQYQLTATTFASGAPGPGTNGQACDDGNVCTTPDVCQSGACGGTPVADGTSCDDGSACTGPDQCVGGACTAPASPAVGCKLPVVSGKASLLVKNDFPETRDRLEWKWVKGDATTVADFGDPVGGAGYELCVFDESAGVPALASHTLVPGGAEWSQANRGYRFRDPTSQHGGVRSIRLKDGDPGRASISFAAKGALLMPPALPLHQDPSVIVQLIGANACFEARYSTNREDDGLKFKARAD